jgi:S-adenosylmethionine synthetase
VITSIDRQSADIALGVDERGDHEQGAGDQGLMFGYACNETPEMMPMPILYAHRLSARMAEVRKRNILNFLRPDGKTQVTIQYINGKAIRVDAVVLAAQHTPEVKYSTLREGLTEEVIKKVIPAELIDRKTKYYINTTGRFVIGGPKADCGVTGRKIIVDTYGGVGSHGGGCFSGKDPSKVDRSGSYMARYVAKNIIAAGLAEKVEVQIAYTIGVADPVSVMIDTGGTWKIPPDDIAKLVREQFDLRPSPIIRNLNLLRPIYKKTACYGHFGRNDDDFTWERTDMAEKLRKAAKL